MQDESYHTQVNSTQFITENESKSDANKEILRGRVLKLYLSVLSKFLSPYTHAVENNIIGTDEKINMLKYTVSELETEVLLLRDQLKSLNFQQKQSQDILNGDLKKMEIMAKEITRTKWVQKDYLNTLQQPSILKCGLCGYSGGLECFETVESDCIFSGGHLVRYVCPNCGVIFGPTKFTSLNSIEQADDYSVHYIAFHEGDSTWKEMKAFKLLNPSKDGVYLNYGCGSWSKTIELLNAEGYLVYGYEPYSLDVIHEKIITNRDELSKMRFTGIFSNDLLEHLIDPVAELKFMKGLLALPSSQMAHCTPCYNYAYEYTRFHAFFFTGNSIEVICNLVGLNFLKTVEDEHDFICKIFLPKESSINCLFESQNNDLCEKKDGVIVMHKGGIVYGPYITLPSGKYVIELEIECSKNLVDVYASVTSLKGLVVHQVKLLDCGLNAIEFILEQQTHEVEFVICNNKSEFVLKKLTLS